MKCNSDAGVGYILFSLLSCRKVNVSGEMAE